MQGGKRGSPGGVQVAQASDNDGLDVGRGSGEDLGLDEGSWALRGP